MHECCMHTHTDTTHARGEEGDKAAEESQALSIPWFQPHNQPGQAPEWAVGSTL